MRKRHKNSGGQALVMVTLGLIAMGGLMGLAVDMGWSYFVQKKAQAAADGAALAAVQEAMAAVRGSGLNASALSCTGGAANVTGVACLSSVTACSNGSIIGTNLQNGCLYAKTDGFDYTTASSRQNVTMQSGSGTPPTAPGVVNIAYWVTARTVEVVPQLFSPLLGANFTQGTVSAIATAGIVGSVQPGSFFGMNRLGDCMTDSGGSNINCGLDVSDSATGNAAAGQCAAANASLCAPAGIILASSCAAVGPGCSQAYAAAGGKNGGWGSSLTVMSSGALTGAWNPSTPTYSTNPNTFADPTAPNSQPPLQTPSSPIGSCGYANGQIPSGGKNGTVTLGPYQYYSYKMVAGVPIPDGNQISVPDGATFSASATGCPGGLAIYTPGASQSSSFPSYIFWGGMQVQGNVSLGAGQYVMAGVNTASDGAGVLNVNGNGITGDTTTGTMIILTDGNYPGLSGQLAGIPNESGNMPQLYQGTISNLKNSNINLTGIVNSTNPASSLPSSMDVYSGVAIWQDRRNSTVGYDEPSGTAGCSGSDCTGDNGSVIYCNIGCTSTGSTPAKLAAMVTANHVTPTSPGMTMDPGNGNIAINGVFYQPRGAWMEFVHGTTGFSCNNGPCAAQVITGELTMDTGNVALTLAGPTNPLLTYHTALIQ